MNRFILITFALLCSIGLRSQTLVPELFASGFNEPVVIAHAGDDRIFVVEQPGIIKVIENGSTSTLLNMTQLVGNSANEQGLLGLAFHPDFAVNGYGYFFVNYTNNSGATTISRFTVASNGTVSINSELIILVIAQPFSNHNGGGIAFSPVDGYLYIGTGDGGSGGDPYANSQNTQSLLGKMLRLDVNGISNSSPYFIPSDNPFINNSSYAPEIWSLGLRNPWRFSFDRDSGDMWIGDVGQTSMEEIDFELAGNGGENYGWRCYEGTNSYNTSGCGGSSLYTFPIHQYNHNSGGCSVTGGYIYRGSQYPNLVGKYIFADFCTAEFWLFDSYTQSVTLTSINTPYVATFGEDNNGELYYAGLYDGNIYKITDTSVVSTGCTDSVACNYNSNAISDDGSCTYADFGYDCDGNCTAGDLDEDGICDACETMEYIVVDCECEFIDPLTYTVFFTDVDEVNCVTYEDCYCECLNDINGDGVCDTLCSEDLNSDGAVSVQDLLLVLSEFGCASSCLHDINQDGYVTVADILLILSVFGNICE